MSARLDQASIPATWYLDPHVFELELEFIFRRTWQWVGRTDQLASPGAYFTCEVAGEPIVVVRDEDGILRAFSNVCRHKAGPVAQGSGLLKRFRCAYHSWTYGLDGSLLGTPYFSDVEGFTKEENCLPQIRVGTWGPLVFVNLDPDARPFLEVLGDIPKRFSRYPLSDLIFSRGIKVEHACNWKVLEENGRECYHCPSVHPSFRTAYQVEDVELERLDLCSLMYIPERCSIASQATDDEEVEPLASDIIQFRRQSQLDELQGKETTGYYLVFIFPNFVLSLQADLAFAEKRIPTTVDQVTLVRDYFLWRGHPEVDIEGNWDFRMRTVNEDRAICEEVQKRLHSRYYKHGWCSPKELLVHHFVSLLKRSLSASLNSAEPR